MSSHDSTPSSPISTSSTLTEEKSTRTMADMVKNLKLKESQFKIFRQEIDGLAFLELTEERLERCGFAIRPSIKLSKFIDELQEQKLRSFSLYKTLEELKDVLHKYKVNGEDITNIKQFNPVFEEIDDNNKALEQCMNEIILRLSNFGNNANQCQ